MRLAALLVAPLLLTASIALADDAPSFTTPATPNSATPAVEKGIPKTPEIQPQDPATSPETANAMADLKRIRQRAGEVDPKEQEATEKSLRETAAEVDAGAAKKDKVEVAGRLAAQFGGIPELYLGEHDRLKQGWGELSIAHTILTNSKTSLSIDQLFDLRQEKLGWGQIAHGLDLNVGEFTKMAQANGHSAIGAASGAGKSEMAEAKGAPAAKSETASNGKSDATPAAAKSSTPAGSKSAAPSATPHGNSKK
jgi:hypothetical protein